MLYSTGPRKKPRDQEGKTHGVLKQSGKVRESTPNSHRLSASTGQCKSYSEGQPEKDNLSGVTELSPLLPVDRAEQCCQLTSDD